MQIIVLILLSSAIEEKMPEACPFASRERIGSLFVILSGIRLFRFVKKGVRWSFECFSQSKEYFQGNRLEAAFDEADICAVQVALLSQLFLRDTDP